MASNGPDFVAISQHGSLESIHAGLQRSLGAVPVMYTSTFYLHHVARASSDCLPERAPNCNTTGAACRSMLVNDQALQMTENTCCFQALFPLS